MMATLRTMLNPGVPIGTLTIEWRWWRAASGRSSVTPVTPVTPVTMAKRHSGCMAPVVTHMRPLITDASPSRRMVVAMLLASDEATSGSAMVTRERISPASSGFNQRSCCAALANRCSSSVLPVSGRCVVPRVAESEALVTQDRISGWGGIDSRTGTIVATRHELGGISFAGKVLVVPGAKGSSGWSSAVHG